MTDVGNADFHCGKTWYSPENKSWLKGIRDRTAGGEAGYL